MKGVNFTKRDNFIDKKFCRSACFKITHLQVKQEEEDVYVSFDLFRGYTLYQNHQRVMDGSQLLIILIRSSFRIKMPKVLVLKTL